MGERIGIDDIITMEDGKAEVKKSEPALKEKIKEKLKKTEPEPRSERVQAKPVKTKTEKRTYGRNKAEKEPEPPKEKPKDVSELMKEAKPPSKEKAVAVLEAALFMANKPLMLDELARISGINSLGYLKQSLEKIQKEYEGRGIHVVSDRDGWRMQVRHEHLPHVAHLTPYSDISEGCKRTLALVVYKEPMNQAHLIKIQGNKAYTYIKELKRRGLLKTEKRGRTMVLKLTKEFDRYFGDERENIRKEMIKEFGDPAKVFAALNRVESKPTEMQEDGN